MTKEPEPQRTTVSLAALEAPKANPRTSFHETAIEGLAASILEDGLLQNLVVTPHGRSKKKPRYRIISGERRFRALQVLETRGDIPADHPIPVEIRGALDDTTALRLATVENVQRENLSPMDEAEAFARLAAEGQDLAEIAAKTGCSTRTVERRLALTALCEDAKTALREHRIGLAEAQALTLGSAEAQQSVLERITRGWSMDAEDIRHALAGDNPTVAMAVFPIERYTGSLTQDLFAEEETTYFEDAEQFMRLQEEAVEELAAEHGKTAAWVEITHDRVLRAWDYREAEEGEPAGTIINLSPSGHVEIAEGLVKRPEPAPEPKASPRPRPAYSRPLCREIAYTKTLAVQAALIGNPRTTKLLTVLGLLHPAGVHDALKNAMENYESLSPWERGLYDAVNGAAHHPLKKLTGRRKPGAAGGAWLELLTLDLDTGERYERLKTLSDEELDQLLTLVSVLRIGQADCDSLDTEPESLFNRVAADLEIGMREVWTPDAGFLERHSKDQLAGIARASGAGLTCIRKAEFVQALAKHFAEAKAAANPTDRQRKANDWLPEAMRFPAIDPDAPSAAEVEAEAEETDRAAA